MRGIAYTRDQRDRHIKRKEKILRNQRLDNPPHRYNDGEAVNNNIKNYFISEGNWHFYHIPKHEGCLNKGKIHCSCGLCSAKTRNKGKRRHIHGGNSAPALNYCIRDLRRLQQMDWDESNWDDDVEWINELEDLMDWDDEVGYWISDEELNELIALLPD